jgi:hypothetical protein
MDVWQRAAKARKLSSREDGETLAELMVAIAILGIAIVTIVGSMAAAIGLSSLHRRQASAATVLVAAADAVKSKPYVACTTATAPDYSLGNADVEFPPGFSASNVTVGNVRMVTIDPTSGAATTGACPGIDTNVQVVTVTVSKAASKGYIEGSDTAVSVDVIKRGSS